MKLIPELYFLGLTYFTKSATIFNTMFYYTQTSFILGSNSYNEPFNVIKNKPYFSEKWDILFL